MDNNLNLDALIKLAEKQKENLATNMQIMDARFAEFVGQMTEEQKAILDKQKLRIKEAIRLQTDGKTAEANQILKDLENEYKDY